MTELFSFRGRTSRLGYWRLQCLCVAVAAAVLAAGYLAIMDISPVFGVVLLILPALVVAGWAAGVRRLHDRGKTIWWWLLFQFGPFAGLGVAHALAGLGSSAAILASLPFSLAAISLAVWGLVEIGFLRGQPAANRFGEAPVPGAGFS